MAEYSRILIVKPSSLGDIVHALPTLSALRTRFPKASISWLVKQEWADLLHRVEHLDRVWPVGSGLQGWLAEVRGLRAACFDLVVDLQGLLRSGMIAWLAGSPVRIGFANAREGSPWLYTDRVAVPDPDMHAVERYLLVAQALGATVPAQPLYSLKVLAADILQALRGDRGRFVDGRERRHRFGVYTDIAVHRANERFACRLDAVCAEMHTEEQIRPMLHGIEIKVEQEALRGDLKLESLADFLQRAGQRLHIFHCVGRSKTGTDRRGHAQPVMQGHGAMVAGTHRHALLVEQRANVVWVSVTQ